MQIPKVRILEPPYDIRGSGRPTIGISPMTIDMFMKVCQKKIAISPMANMESKNRRDDPASHINRINRIRI